MSTSPAIWQSLSQWNRFRFIYDWSELIVQYHVVIQTRVASQVHLNACREKRLEDLLQLRSLGWSDKQIADHLNVSGQVTPSGKSYSGKLVWATLKKFNDRKRRGHDVRCFTKSERLILRR